MPNKKNKSNMSAEDSEISELQKNLQETILGNVRMSEPPHQQQRRGGNHAQPGVQARSGSQRPQGTQMPSHPYHAQSQPQFPGPQQLPFHTHGVGSQHVPTPGYGHSPTHFHGHMSQQSQGNVHQPQGFPQSPGTVPPLRTFGKMAYAHPHTPQHTKNSPFPSNFNLPPQYQHHTHPQSGGSLPHMSGPQDQNPYFKQLRRRPPPSVRGQPPPDPHADHQDRVVYASQPHHMGQYPPNRTIQPGYHPQFPNHDRPRQLWHPGLTHPPPGPPRVNITPQAFAAQCSYLDELVAREGPKVEMSSAEYEKISNWQMYLNGVIQSALKDHLPQGLTPIITIFGSVKSGFATAGSDVDLAFQIVADQEDGIGALDRFDQAQQHGVIPRILERAFLDHGLGAHLLTKTRVPILKLCENPTPELRAALLKERNKYDEDVEQVKDCSASKESNDHDAEADEPEQAQVAEKEAIDSGGEAEEIAQGQADRKERQTGRVESQAPLEPAAHKPRKKWLREKPLGPLDFPKSGIGIQADINFSSVLGLHNTSLLCCYNACDARVQPMVLFIKSWAKARKINSSRNGTLSSYGYVLMVLHFLVNVADPPVMPNLQLLTERNYRDAFCERTGLSIVPESLLPKMVESLEVAFWNDEKAIRNAAENGILGKNTNELGVLLRNFFHYFAYHGWDVPKSGFNWMKDVLSLRSYGGIVSKESKAWQGARTYMLPDGREVRNRYLFAIEDPFEIEHNVARTVTHNGVMTIREEFRRAWEMLMFIGIEASDAQAVQDVRRPTNTWGGLMDKLEEG